MIAKITKYLKFASLFCLLYTGTITSSPISGRSKRSSWPQSPCLNVPEFPDNPVDITPNLENLLQRATDLESKTTDTIDFVGADFPSMTKNYLDQHLFLESPDAEEEIASGSVSETNSTLQSHIEPLLNMYYHIKNCSESGEISTQNGDNTEKEQLTDIHSEIYSMVCAINNALIYQKVNASIDLEEPIYSEDFTALSAPYHNELYRAYIILRDCEKMMGYLKEIYSEMVGV